jgi:FAD/FMN-containing dehydrogenase
MDSSRTAFEAKKAALIAQLADTAKTGTVALQKDTSNLFRARGQSAKRIDVRGFTSVIAIDPERLTAEVEGMITYEKLVDATLAHGLLPAVVPELKSITIGGAVSGVGIESSSFRYGLVHETIEEMEILTGTGETIVCSRTQNPDLFFGFPNSYGTLGYALRLVVRLIPAQPYVRLIHTRFDDSEMFFAELARICGGAQGNGHLAYVDGALFSSHEMYLTTGEFADTAPYTSDYTGRGIYYRSIRTKREDYLTAHDYIWRWDTDWFWCSKNFGVQNPLVRALAPRSWLNSKAYWKIMKWSHHAPLKWFANAVTGGTESVIQDIQVPIARAAEYYEWFANTIGIAPVWVCPVQSAHPAESFDLYRLDPNTLYVNFGFWDMVPSNHEPGYYNKLVEAKVEELGGCKSLYSTVHYDKATFWRLYNQPAYDRLKASYDPNGIFKDLYAKVIKS